MGFPLALAGAYRLLGVHRIAGIGLQIVLGVATCVLASRIGEQTFGHPAGRLGALALAIYPTHVFYSTLLLSEPLFTLFLVAGGALLLRSLRDGGIIAVMAGAVFGLGILTRPFLAFLPSLTPLWYLANGAGARRAGALGAAVSMAALVVLSPWLIRNHREFGSFWTDLSSTGGYSFYAGNHRDAFGGDAHPAAVTDRLRMGTRYDSPRGYRLG